MSMQLNAPNAGSLNDFANFPWIRIDENAHSADSLRQRIHNSADGSRLNVTRACRIKVKPNHIYAELDARPCIVRICKTADFDLDGHQTCRASVSDATVACLGSLVSL